ncbi:FabD/lysophospholipase-like protein [Stereum hirsutum FP-91666 SS1]|uniref:FabD/lysophospholipase-like protein n=1 Tax=Stereum hirsutum (strain FP-91666) TaxID=721885 RepID=UPI000440C49C|nr:FabD/lysophospholipase-like protein [Stereum hirsutum FP-91666 SS1]EIM88993.1 FabD/lysophospholipase-like protein [Stereum hirsutum FP-91666 SS1]
MVRSLLGLAFLGLPLGSLAVTLSGNYAPTYIQCPSGESYLRPASAGLSTEEATWLAKRKENVVEGLASYLTTVGIQGFDVNGYISALNSTKEAIPTIGFTLSGGGTRAESSAYGMLRAFDGRTSQSVSYRTGGLLQATTYISGLSGGATSLGMVAMSDYLDMDSSLQDGLLLGNYSTSDFDVIAYKAEQGFNITISDIFAVANGINALRVPSNLSVDPLSRLWSDIPSFANFSQGKSPMTILMLNEVIPAGLPGSNSFAGALIPADNANTNGTIYELTPFEFGSWQGRAQAFIKTQYIGTTFANGQPVNDTTCVQGFDTAAFMVGSADAAMNIWYTEAQSNGTVGQFAKRDTVKAPYPPNEDKIEQERVEAQTGVEESNLGYFLELLGNQTLEQSVYGLWPNPFAGLNESDVNLQKQGFLYLVDGSEYGQENPIVPQIQAARSSDFLVVNDAGGTDLSSGWSNGTTFINTAKWAKAQNLSFPTVPSTNTMLNLNHTLFPTFYGCYEEDVPLVLYAADAPYTEYSNITALGDLDSTQYTRLWNNSISLYSQIDSPNANATTDWPTCIACGAIYRSLQRLNATIPEVCGACFEEHCWGGEVDDSQPGFLAPAPLLNPSLTFAEWNTSFYGNSTD